MAEDSDTQTPEEPGLRLQLTGKVALVFEIETYGPITMNINDLEQATTLLKTVLDMMDSNSFTVDAYSNEDEETAIRTILFKQEN
jgi:hypothetical protein